MERFSVQLQKEHLQRIREKAGFGDKHGYLAPEMVDLIVQQDWLRLLVPKIMGGCELPLPEVVAWFEALAWADGNLGWCVNLGSGANMFAGYLDQDTAAEIFNSPRTWCAGSGAISGQAVEVAGGYRLAGRWRYASGAAHATHFTANAYLYQPDGAPVSKAGQPVFRSFILPAADVHVLDTWKVTGLRASSSCDFEIRDVFVPQRRTFSLLQPSPFAKGPVYQFPFALLAVVNMSSMQLGMALHFIDEFLHLAEEKKPLYGGGLLKDYPEVRALLDNDLPAFYETRGDFYHTLRETWAYYEQGGAAPAALQETLRTKSLLVADAALELVAAIYPFCGMSVVYEENALNKIWRDISTGRQHFIFSPLNKSV